MDKSVFFLILKLCLNDFTLNTYSENVIAQAVEIYIGSYDSEYKKLLPFPAPLDRMSSNHFDPYSSANNQLHS